MLTVIVLCGVLNGAVIHLHVAYEILYHTAAGMTLIQQP